MIALPEPYYDFLRLLTWLTQPALVVELGTREGWSALSFALGNAGRVVSIDINPGVRRADTGHERVEYRVHDSLAVDPDLNDIDILFIDTDHNGIHYGQRAREEYEAWEGQVRRGGIIVFDDVLINDYMRDMWNALLPIRGTKLTLDVHQGCGMGVLLL